MPTEYEQRLGDQRRKVVDFIKQCAQEARVNEKFPRREQNKKNWDYFHGTIDWSHKRDEDPRIHLHKVGVAAERTRSKFKQQLLKFDNWGTVEREYYNPEAKLPDYAARNILVKHLEKADAKTVISDAILCATLESRLTIKIGGKYVVKPRYTTKNGARVKEEKKIWELDLKVLPFEQYLVDTMETDCPLYEIEEFRTDKYRVLDLASEDQSADKPFRLDAVKELGVFAERDQEEAQKHAAGNLLKTDQIKYRKPVLIQNFFGTILADDGSVMEWENEDGTKQALRNIFCVCANEDALLIDPRNNLRWSARAPFASTDLMRSPGNGRKAIMDAGTDLNQAMDELFSLMLTGAIKAVHNITWYRDDWISDKKALSGGIRDGSQIPIDGSAPANGIPIGVIKTGEVPQDAFLMYQTADRAFAENVLSNQIDLSGGLPGKQVRATELVQASGAISDMFDSMASDVEDVAIEVLLEEAFMECMQHLDEMDPDEVRGCFLGRPDLADAFLALPPKERFNEVNGQFKFKGKGLHGLIANAAKSQAMINLLNTITANPITFQAVESQVSAAKIIRMISKGLGIDVEEIAPDAQERQMIEQKQMVREQALAQAELMGQQPGQQGQPGNASQGSQPQPNQPGNGQEGVQ